MAARSALAIGLSRRSVGVVRGKLGAQSLRIVGHLQTRIPDDVDPDDADALGTWLGEVLRANKLKADKATVAMARDQLGVKRLMLPSIDPVELPEMVRLSMQRELPFDAADAVIDFLPIDASESSTTVIAVAIPGEALAFVRRVMRAARVPVERVTPRVMWIGALLPIVDDDPSAPQLTIDVVGDAIEFAVVSDGRVQFSRAAEVADRPGEMTVDAVVTETRRTWMSYRIVESSSDVVHATVLGPADIGENAAVEIASLLSVSAHRLGSHPRIDTESGDLGEAWPLAGLLLRPLLGRDVINLLEPRKAPDVGARRRQFALGAIGLFIVIVAGLSMLAMLEMKRLDTELATLTTKARAARPMRVRVKRDLLKQTHLQQWETVSVDWLAEIEKLASLAPGTSVLVLDGWSGSLDFPGVDYSRDGDWSAPHSMRITLEGEAADRATADAYRDSLVETEYTTSSSGADAAGGRRLDHGFTYTLKSDALVTEAVTGAAPAGAQAENGGPAAGEGAS
jgi:hypothetical protein